MFEEVIKISLQTDAKPLSYGIDDGSPVTDEQLVERVLSGGESAFAEIFDETIATDRLITLLKRSGHSHHTIKGKLSEV